jgi:hypothetical protein
MLVEQECTRPVWSGMSPRILGAFQEQEVIVGEQEWCESKGKGLRLAGIRRSLDQWRMVYRCPPPTCKVGNRS